MNKTIRVLALVAIIFSSLQSFAWFQFGKPDRVSCSIISSGQGQVINSRTFTPQEKLKDLGEFDLDMTGEVDNIHISVSFDFETSGIKVNWINKNKNVGQSSKGRLDSSGKYSLEYFDDPSYVQVENYGPILISGNKKFEIVCETAKD